MPQEQPTASSEPHIVPPSVLRRKRKRRNRIIAVAFAAAALVGYYWAQGDEQGPQAEPLIATAQMGSIENTIPASGSLKPRTYVDVGAQVSGQLQRLYVEVGDTVEQGDLLAEIDARVQQNRVDSSRASIESLEAQLEARRSSLELARANAQRQHRLMEADATSQLDYDTAMTNLMSAESNLIQLEKQIEQSLASLSSDETQLEFTRIYAPLSGTVVSVELTEGRTLNASQQSPTVLRIADLSTMTVETEISEADIGSIERGMDVYFTTLGSGDRRWYGQLRQIRPTPQVQNNVVLYTGLFDIENSDGKLLPEMTAQVHFVTSSAQDVLTVPMGALSSGNASGGAGAARANGLEGPSSGPDPFNPEDNDFAAGASPDEDGQFSTRVAAVTVVRPDGTLEERDIEVGITSRIAAEVVSGLRPGDRVVAGIIEGTAQNGGGGGGGRGGFRLRGF